MALALLFAPEGARAAAPPECYGWGLPDAPLQLEVGDLPVQAGSCFDPDDDDLIITITLPPQKGTAEVVNQGTPFASVFYSASAVGADSVTFTANDGSSDSMEATITTDNLPAVDDPPYCLGLTEIPLEVGEPGSAVPCYDEEGDSLTLTITEPPQKGTLEVVDQATPAPALTYTATAIGADSFSYKASDGSADSDEATTTTANFDTHAPETTIVSGPAGLTADATPTFGFSSNESGSSFDCRVDGGPWAACTSPITLARLNQGPHNFEVRARDAAGNLDASSARRDFHITATTPAAGPPLPAPDVAAPTFSLTGKKTQKVGRAIRVVVTAVSEDLWASLSGRVSIPGASTRYKLTGSKKRFIARADKATLRAKMPGKTVAAIERALRAHKKIKAALRLKARDAAGNIATARITIRLKR